MWGHGGLWVCLRGSPWAWNYVLRTAMCAGGQYDPDPSLIEVPSVPLETSRHGKRPVELEANIVQRRKKKCLHIKLQNNTSIIMKNHRMCHENRVWGTILYSDSFVYLSTEIWIYKLLQYTCCGQFSMTALYTLTSQHQLCLQVFQLRSVWNAQLWTYQWFALTAYHNSLVHTGFCFTLSSLFPSHSVILISVANPLPHWAKN